MTETETILSDQTLEQIVDRVDETRLRKALLGSLPTPPPLTGEALRMHNAYQAARMRHNAAAQAEAERQRRERAAETLRKRQQWEAAAPARELAAIDAEIADATALIAEAQALEAKLPALEQRRAELATEAKR